MSNLTFRAADNTFGPFVEPISTTYFDFTRLFEESIFSIGPSALLLLAVPPRIWYLSRIPRKVSRSPLALGKLVSLLPPSKTYTLRKVQLLFACYTILQAINLSLWTTTSPAQTRTSITAAALSLAASAGLACLSHMEHLHSIRPSPIINAYLLFTLPLDFAQVRTLWLRGGPVAVSVTFTSLAVAKAALLVAETVEKGGLILSAFRSDSPEATSGIYSRALFWWLNPLFLLGYKNVLSNDSLFAIDVALMSQRVYARFAGQLARCMYLFCERCASSLTKI